MSTRLGIDLGTTFTSAAVSRDGDVEVVRLESDRVMMPSVVAFDGNEVLTGVAAERRLAESPTSGVREFKRRLGDTTPFILDGAPRGAEVLTGHLLSAVVDRAGANVDSVRVAHPANWGEYKLELLRDAGRLAGIGDVELIAEPVAAALHYAAAGNLEPGAAVAVYDFGGGTFDAAVVRLTADGAELLGRPEGLERLGGVDVDQMVLAHVDASLDGALSGLDTSDPEVRKAIVALRQACTEAKEALSADTDAGVPVRLPALTTEVRITRAELESMLAARIDDTLAALDRTITAAGVNTTDLAGVLLVGGTSRIPSVAERVASHTGRPTLTDADHNTVVAAGAAAVTATPLTASVATATPAATPSDSKREKAKGAGEQPARPARRVGLGTIGRAAAAVGAIGAGGAGGYASWRYFRDGDDERVVEDTVDLTSDTETSAADSPPDLSELAFLNDIAATFSQTPQGQVTSAVFQAAATRPVAPPPPIRSRPAPTQPTAPGRADGPAPAPAPPPVSPIVSDPRIEDVRDQLRNRLEGLAVPEGATEEDVARLREDLDGLLERFQPYPGQPADDAVAALKYEFEDRVRDFAQDQRIDAVIDEQRRQVEEAEVAEAELSDFRDTLRERLENWTPPEGADAAEVAELRETLEGMIDRATAFPGQSAEDAMADLRLEFNDQVGDFAQDLKIDALVEAERDETDDAESPAAPAEEPDEGDTPSEAGPTDTTTEDGVEEDEQEEEEEGDAPTATEQSVGEPDVPPHESPTPDETAAEATADPDPAAEAPEAATDDEIATTPATPADAFDEVMATESGTDAEGFDPGIRYVRDPEQAAREAREGTGDDVDPAHVATEEAIETPQMTTFPADDIVGDLGAEPATTTPYLTANVRVDDVDPLGSLTDPDSTAALDEVEAVTMDLLIDPEDSFAPEAPAAEDHLAADVDIPDIDDSELEAGVVESFEADLLDDEPSLDSMDDLG